MTGDTVTSLLRQRSSDQPDKLFAWCGDEQATYGQVDHRSDVVAAGLRQLGVKAGENIAILLPNRMEMVDLFFACAKLGCPQVPLNVFLKGEFLRYQIGSAQATTLVTDRPGHQAVLALAGDISLQRVIVVDSVGDLSEGAVPYEVLLQLGEAAVAGHQDAPCSPGDVMSILYTSGTTGLPKGCVLPHGLYVWGAKSWIDFFDMHSSDVLLTAMPLFHSGARGVLTATLVAGSAIVFEPEFHGSQIMARAAETGATILGGVGAMGVALLNQPPRPSDRQHGVTRVWFVPFTEAQREEFKSRFGVEDVLTELYGQTECHHIARNSRRGRRRPDTDGRAVPGFEVRIIDEAGEEVPPGTVGEIVARPDRPNIIFHGYWQNWKATVSAFRDLWYHTGDLGRMDAEGFLTFIGRKKDAIRRRGENVSSFEVEQAIAAFDGIAEVAVHAVPGELNEDEIKACMVLQPGAEISPDAIFDYLVRQLPYYAVPRYVEILAAMPKNAMGRIMKEALRANGFNDSTWDLTEMGLVVERAERRRHG